MSKLNCLYNAEKIFSVIKCIRNGGGDNLLKVGLSIQWSPTKLVYLFDVHHLCPGLITLNNEQMHSGVGN